MWLLKYYLNEVTLEKIDSAELINKEELLNDPKFIEANVFGDNKSLYLSKKNPELIDLCDTEKDNNGSYIDENMKVSVKFLKKNHIDGRFSVRVRNYYDFNSDGIIYISSSRIVDMEAL